MFRTRILYEGYGLSLEHAISYLPRKNITDVWPTSIFMEQRQPPLSSTHDKIDMNLRKLIQNRVVESL